MKLGIFIDLDGTLINDQKNISDLDMMIINHLKEDFNIYLITGKSLINALPYYQKLNLNTKLITSMGQLISNPSNALFKPILQTTEVTSLKVIMWETLKLIKIDNVLLETSAGNYYVLEKETSNLTNLICHNLKQLILLKDYNVPNVISVYFELAFLSKEKLFKVINTLNKRYLKQFDFSFWDTGENKPIIHLKPANVGKSQAMLKVQKLDNLAHTIALGNGWSDRNMLKKASLGIAMFNAELKVQKRAKLITLYDNNNSGVGKMLVSLFPEKFNDQKFAKLLEDSL